MSSLQIIESLTQSVNRLKQERELQQQRINKLEGTEELPSLRSLRDAWRCLLYRLHPCLSGVLLVRQRIASVDLEWGSVQCFSLLNRESQGCQIYHSTLSPIVSFFPLSDTGYPV